MEPALTRSPCWGGRCDLQRSSVASLTGSAGPQGRSVWPGAGGGKGQARGERLESLSRTDSLGSHDCRPICLAPFSNCTPYSTRGLRIYLRKAVPRCVGRTGGRKRWSRPWLGDRHLESARWAEGLREPLLLGLQTLCCSVPALMARWPCAPRVPPTGGWVRGSPPRVTRLQPLCHREDGAGSGSRRLHLPRTLFNPDVSSRHADAAPQHPTLKSPTSPGL